MPPVKFRNWFVEVRMIYLLFIALVCLLGSYEFYSMNKQINDLSFQKHVLEEGFKACSNAEQEYFKQLNAKTGCAYYYWDPYDTQTHLQKLL